jgi:hypothetical protein
MFKGTGKPLPLNHLLLIFYHMGHKMNEPPDSIPVESDGIKKSDSDGKDE